MSSGKASRAASGAKRSTFATFIQKNYKPYAGDERFLAGPTEATDKLWGILQKLQKEERAKGGVLDMETHVVSGLTAYGAGYISEADKALGADCRPADG